MFLVDGGLATANSKYFYLKLFRWLLAGSCFGLSVTFGWRRVLQWPLIVPTTLSLALAIVLTRIEKQKKLEDAAAVTDNR